MSNYPGNGNPTGTSGNGMQQPYNGQGYGPSSSGQTYGSYPQGNPQWSYGQQAGNPYSQDGYSSQQGYQNTPYGYQNQPAGFPGQMGPSQNQQGAYQGQQAGQFQGNDPRYAYNAYPVNQGYDRYTAQNPYMPQGGQQPGQEYGINQPVQIESGSQQKKAPLIKPRQVISAILVFVIPLLFLLGMFAPGMPSGVLWAFIVLAALGLSFVWAGQLMRPNSRFTFTIVYLALIGIALYTAISSSGTADTRNTGSTLLQQSTVSSESAQYSDSNSSADALPGMTDVTTEGEVYTNDSSLPESQTPDPGVSAITQEMLERLSNFMSFWKVNSIENMVSLCMPSWTRQQSSAADELFKIMANRTPIDWETGTISGTDSDSTRTVTLVATIDRHWPNTNPAKFQFKVVMAIEDDNWYVDPRTLGSNEVTPTPYKSAEITQPPQPAKDAAPDTILYYNPDGGTMYHLNPDCPQAAAKYRPFKGSFTYAEINNEPYASLNPCSSCGSPLRPK